MALERMLAVRFVVTGLWLCSSGLGRLSEGDCGTVRYAHLFSR